ncbi:Xanthine and CO dehydrogenase maturation factor, XdhC/CoxF family [Arcticibacter svalbardensis MN12-7]|uniref:Xanthine and CO dehydrogenase maturation factor, XdhC/CoxF family n=1 Tax=Arcticibacter svalbardensis MN12-7 TaxID=1150600 RepID=R9GP58_9SPHI|nr:XdhC/CoxI family protein [Arcticibacter svalbardensis]EOR93508.1 Xanthine and CO dehydrogenase maturation factor, XdhC/CoxF family [Arcticibacter svalbardensis MN12-7]
MKEIRDILKAFSLADKEGKKTALATIVQVEGSSYRRAGARMLITDEGQLTGAISGGCLEGDALRKALLAISEQRNKLVTYDTTDEDDAKFGVQLGCNGIVHILFEPIDPAKANNAIQLLQELVKVRKDAVLVTLFSLNQTEQPGTSLLYRFDKILSSLPINLQQAILFDVQDAMQTKLSFLKNYEDQDAFIEFISPPVAVIIAGAGNDAIPLVEMTTLLGWHTTVLDGRPTHATPERFNKADQVLVVKPDEVLSKVNIDAQTVFVLMTHNYNYDLVLLAQLLQKNCAYIGTLGPAKKLDRMLEEIKANGQSLNEQHLSPVYGPVGLDIGAETAEEIALSIVAEIKSVLAGQSGIPLREKKQPIHARAINTMKLAQ